MRILVVTFLILGVEFARTASVGEATSGTSAPVGSCGSKWDDFTSFIGEEIVMRETTKTMNKAECCIHMKVPTDMKQKYMKCIISTIKITMQELGNGTAKTPTTSDWKRWYENYIACLFQDLNIPTTETGFDHASIKEIKIEDWVEKPEDKTKLRNLINSCVDGSTGATAVQQMLSVQRCLVDQTISLCQSRGEPEGMIMQIVKGFLTLWDDSVCSGVQLPQQLYDSITECIAMTETKWEADGFAKFTSTSMMKYNNSDVKNAMYFLKMYGQNFLLNFAQCTSEKMGVYNKTTETINFQRGEEIFSGLKGWSSPQVMDSVVTAFKGCEIAQNETALMKMSEMERNWSFMKTCMKFKECFFPKFINICGLNNDLATLGIPILNNNLIGSIGKNFKDKKGQLAIMHIIPALKEQFSDIFPDMVMNMMKAA